MSTKKAGCIFYRDVFGGWRWEHTDASGEITDSNASYETREECVAAAVAAGQTQPAAAPARDSEGLDALRSRTILCACPDVSRHDFLRATLQPARTVMVVRGDESLRALHHETFDAHVLDYWLPDWSGVALAREIRKGDPHVPIVFFSKASSDDSKRRAFRAGCDVFLSTPADNGTLRRRVSTLIASRENAKHAAEEAAKEALKEALQSPLPAHAPQAPAPTIAAMAIERRARVQALSAFIASGGTRADFERMWTGMFSSIGASTALASQAA